MGFTVATSIQILFAIIGLGITLYSDIKSDLSTLVCIILFVLVPALGAYGTYFKKPNAILVSLVFFLSQSVRSISTDNIIPNIMPITISFSFGDFLNGQGYLIDFFAISMAIFLAWLLRLAIPTKNLKRDC
ncbi:MAG: hypothetical protein ACI9LM_000270 [Alteromonadaceae bacterium]|jgi:hypothetical protein